MTRTPLKGSFPNIATSGLGFQHVNFKEEHILATVWHVHISNWLGLYFVVIFTPGPRRKVSSCLGYMRQN